MQIHHLIDKHVYIWVFMCVSTPMCEYVYVVMSEHVCVHTYIWELTSMNHVYSLSHWVCYRVCLCMDMGKYACVYTCLWVNVCPSWAFCHVNVYHECMPMFESKWIHTCGTKYSVSALLWVCLRVGKSVRICSCAWLIICVREGYLAALGLCW